ncbi:MAG TPA: GDSL-type esterase/lipase family protein [Chryseolinea sp.]|nr:GDSL-type esterase/lipase family protein [Chryseolinea sp.]
MTFRTVLFVSCVLLLFQQEHLNAQPTQFKAEVADLAAKPPKDKKNIVLFTGSSTIKMWTDINSYFPAYNVVNRGFGGSQMTDLLYYADELILLLKPSKIFIYEGDNDLAAGRTQDQILGSADSLLNKIRTKLPSGTQVYFISAKPSVARWGLKDKYIAFNNALKGWSGKKGVTYIDVWNPALDAKGKVRDDIFLQDNLHMNKKGYDIWFKVLSKYLP